MSIDVILVPQGAEYKSVCKGLKRVAVPKPTVFPIPMGTSALKNYLKTWQQSVRLHPHSRVLLMGLCGSLSAQYNVSDIVVYRSCIFSLKTENQEFPPSVSQLSCHPELTATLLNKLATKKAFTGVGLTSDRLIYSANEKMHLGQTYNANVVDMEGFVALEHLSQLGIAVGMVRVVSDDVRYDIPNLTNALNSDGSLQPLPLAMGLLREPIAATRLIVGSLKGLQVLQEVTTALFANRANY
ncbi:phosphorylase [Tolypothrix bouteillei VB521301]|uniref:Phosphorylase n=1 Tax=Tolypothrix bouteillei VB521301 TaxID=1479485 RepID=A0A0C1RKP3_9CYAN|nr:phosphorylase [Tolypothrix bouteillei]KAF3891327.1 phosphorylase [Tolypothrix bouteillei VB521301]